MTPRKNTKREMVDLLVIGAGPAGLSAAENAASEGLITLVLDAAAVIGGQAKFSSRVENYPGFPAGLSGEALMGKFYRQAVKFGADIRTSTTIAKVEPVGKLFYTELSSSEQIVTKVILVACGLSPRKLPVTGLDTFEGSGVFYGAMPNEAKGKSGKNVVIVGGANSAGQAAMNFSDFGANVNMIVRESGLPMMSQYLIDRVTSRNNIKIFYNSQIASAQGNGSLASLTLASGETIPTDFCFIFIGFIPETDWIRHLCNCDDRGFLIADASYMSSTAGIFLAGDVRKDSVKRIASGVGEGSIAVSHIHKYLTAQWADQGV